MNSEMTFGQIPFIFLVSVTKKIARATVSGRYLHETFVASGRGNHQRDRLQIRIGAAEPQMFFGL